MRRDKIPAEAAEAIAQLVELGYIAPPSKDTQETIRSAIRCNKVSLVRALLDTPRMAQAAPLLQELIAQQPDDEWCALALAHCYLSQGKLKGNSGRCSKRFRRNSSSPPKCN